MLHATLAFMCFKATFFFSNFSVLEKDSFVHRVLMFSGNFRISETLFFFAKGEEEGKKRQRRSILHLEFFALIY